jgi:hypothetical protein
MLSSALFAVIVGGEVMGLAGWGLDALTHGQDPRGVRLGMAGMLIAGAAMAVAMAL